MPRLQQPVSDDVRRLLRNRERKSDPRRGLRVMLARAGIQFLRVVGGRAEDETEWLEDLAQAGVVGGKNDRTVVLIRKTDGLEFERLRSALLQERLQRVELAVEL